MRSLFVTSLLFIFCKSVCQNNVVITERNCLDNTCLKIKKLQYTFNPKGQIQEYIIFGEHHNPDTNHVANISKFRYNNSKISERTNHSGKYLNSKINYFYKKGRLSSVQYDDIIIKYFYNKNGNEAYNIMLKSLDTLRTITSHYKQNKLSEILRYTNDIDYEKTTFSKLNDTIVETIVMHDSMYVDKPWIVIKKKKYNGSNVIYLSSFYEDDKSLVEYTINYDSFGNVIEINSIINEQNQIKKNKKKFGYSNGLLDKIENFELINNFWQSKDLIRYEIQKSFQTLKHKMKKKINLYFIQQHLDFIQ